jgi:hypothetical protein
VAEGRTGRKTKATDARIEVVMSALKAGNTRRAAAAYAEISPQTFYRWLDENGAFRDAVEKAEADAEVRYASIVARAATSGTWQAAAWWLERRKAQDFGRMDRVEVTVNTKEIAEKVAGDLDVDILMAEAERILAESR